VRSVPRLCNAGKLPLLLPASHVEAGSNTSTVALRVLGGDEKGSLEYETVRAVMNCRVCELAIML
jgi:hypothetical protein